MQQLNERQQWYPTVIKQKSLFTLMQERASAMIPIHIVATWRVEQ
jgi:hypothetical protein